MPPPRRPQYRTSCTRERAVRHDLRKHLQRRRASGHVPPHVRGNFVSSAKNTKVRECARVLIQTGGLTVNGIGREALARELCRESRV